MVVLSAAGSGDRRWGGDEVAQEMQDGTVEMVAAADSPGTLRTRRIGRRPTAAFCALRGPLAAGCRTRGRGAGAWGFAKRRRRCRGVR